jgi:sugar phosphate permease
MSNSFAAVLARRNIHYGWVVAGTTFLTMLVTAGAVGAPGVFILPLQKEFGWQTADISAALAIRLLLFGLMGPFAAALMNRFGVRRIATTALLIIASGLLLSTQMTQVWQLVLLWGFVIGIGTGLTALVLGATVATRWFTQRRGLVVGLLTASSATGQLVFLPLLASLTDRVGWRVSILVVCGAMAIALVVVTALMRDRPSDVGLAPYGETTPAAPPPAAISSFRCRAVLADHGIA